MWDDKTCNEGEEEKIVVAGVVVVDDEICYDDKGDFALITESVMFFILTLMLWSSPSLLWSKTYATVYLLCVK